jgi:tRNA1(Val) A37 N6-methylase TrmN6
MGKTERMELWPGGPVFRQAAHAPLGTDSVLLADFAAGKAAQGIDLGCGSGILMLLLLSGAPQLKMTGLELREDAALVARENLAANGLAARGGVLTGDIRRVREFFRSGSFDLCVTNPPYFPAGSGASAPDPARAQAREETDCTLDELCAAAAWLLPTGGRFCVVHRPERLSELLCAMTRHGLEPKRLRLCCHRPGAAPNLLLAEGRRGGRPGLTVEPILYLSDAEGRETEELRRIYHR